MNSRFMIMFHMQRELSKTSFSFHIGNTTTFFASRPTIYHKEIRSCRRSVKVAKELYKEITEMQVIVARRSVLTVALITPVYH